MINLKRKYLKNVLSYFTKFTELNNLNNADKWIYVLRYRGIYNLTFETRKGQNSFKIETSDVVL